MRWTGNGLADGVTITAGNVNTAGNGDTVTRATTGTVTSWVTAGDGMAVNSPNTGIARLDCPISPGATVGRGIRGQVLVTMSSLPTAVDYFIAALNTGATLAGRVAVNTTGTLRLHNSAGANVGSLSPALAAGEPYLVDLIVQQNAGTLTTTNGRLVLKVTALGSDAATWNGGVPHYQDVTGINLSTTADIPTVRHGKQAGAWTSAVTYENMGWDAVSLPAGTTGQSNVDPYFMPNPYAGSPQAIASTTATVSTTPSMDLPVVHPLGSTTPVVSTAAAEIGAGLPIGSRTDAVSTTAGALNVVHPLASTTPVVSTTPSAIDVRHPLSSVTVVVSTTPTSAVNVRHPLASTTPVVSTSSGEIRLGGAIGSVTPAVVATACSLNVVHPLGSVTPVVSTFAGEIGGGQPLASRTDVLSTCVASLNVRHPLASLTPIVTLTPSGAVNVRHPLAAVTAALAASVTAIGAGFAIASRTDAASTAAADLAAGRELASETAAVSGGASSIDVIPSEDTRVIWGSHTFTIDPWNPDAHDVALHKRRAKAWIYGVPLARGDTRHMEGPAVVDKGDGSADVTYVLRY